MERTSTSTESNSTHTREQSGAPLLVKFRRHQLLKIVICGVISIVALLYTFVAVVAPNRRFAGGSNGHCKIIRAKRFCWRRRVMSLAWVEQAQAARWRSVRALTNRCDSFEKCGNITLPCRFSKGRRDVALRWKFPGVALGVSVSIAVLAAVAIAMFTWQMYKYRPMHISETPRTRAAASMEIDEIWIDTAKEVGCFQRTPTVLN